jgi:hypothetical protein
MGWVVALAVCTGGQAPHGACRQVRSTKLDTDSSEPWWQVGFSLNKCVQQLLFRLRALSLMLCS